MESLRDIKAQLIRLAHMHYEFHKMAFDEWRFGGIDKIWIDKDGFLCIQYESGDWWHYDRLGEWW